MGNLLITKQTGNFFSLQLNDETPIISEQNRLTTIGDFCHFKTVSGANIIKDQNILYSDITLVASGSFTFASVNDLWVKLIEVGFFDGLGIGSGGGGGVDQFTELLDTFNSYIGRDGQALVVNESELKIETVPFSNVSAFTDLSDAPNPLLPNKMIVTNADGTALIMNDLPATPETYLNAVGSFHYSDLATQTTPLSLVANTPKKLENDTLGAYTVVTNAPFGVSSVWNPVTDQLDFTQMSLGDVLTLRVDAAITTSSANQTLKCYAKLGVGSPSEFDLLLAQGQVKTAGEYPFVAEVSFDLAYQDIVDSPAEIYIVSDGNGTIKINGWYISILRKNINIVDISGSDPLKEDKDNKQNSLATDGTGEKYPTVDAVNSGLAGKQNTLTNPVTGTGEANYLPKFTNYASVGNSIMYQRDTVQMDIFDQTKPTGTCSFPISVRKTNVSDNDNSSVGVLFTAESAPVPTSDGIGKAGVVLTRTGGFGIGDFNFLLSSSLDLSPVNFADTKMTIKNSGRVLIGTTTDNGTKFQVAGNITASAATAPEQVVIKSQLSTQIEVGTSQSFQTSWMDNEIIFTASCTITCPSSLVANFNFNWVTLAGVTVTWAITAPHTWLFGTPANAAEKTYGRIVKRGSTNSIIYL